MVRMNKEELEKKYIDTLTPDNTRITAVYIDNRADRQDMNRVMDEYGNIYFIDELEKEK